MTTPGTQGGAMTRMGWIAAVLLVACRLPIGFTREATPLDPPVYARGDTAQLFAPGVISTGDVFASSLTPDGRTVYFTKAPADRSRMDIMQSTWTGSRWSAPVRAPFSTGTRQMDPHVALNGRAVYFTAPRRREAGAQDADGDWDTWVTRLDQDATVATRLTSLANTDANEMYPSLTTDSTLFVGVRARVAPGAASTSPSAGEIRYSHKYLRSAPALVPLTDVVNPSNPYITPNGRILIVSATGTGANANPRRRSDLFLVVRGDDGRWGTPRNLGAEVNTDDVEFCPQLSPDGAYLFFSRVRYDGDRVQGNDVYVVPVRSIPVLRDAIATAVRVIPQR